MNSVRVKNIFRRFLCLFVMLGGGLLSFAQIRDIASLRAAVQSYTKQDTVRVNKLNDLGLEARKNNLQETFNAYTESLALSKKIGYAKGEAIALLGLGFYHRFVADPKPAITYTEEAYTKFALLKDTTNMIACKYNMSSISSYSGTYIPAIGDAIDGLKLAEKSNNTHWIILMNTRLGILYLEFEDHEKAEYYFKTGLVLAEKVGDKDGIVHCLDGVGSIEEKKGNWDEALKVYKRCQQIDAELKDQRNVIVMELNISDMYQRKGENDKVFERIYDAKEKLTQLKQIGYLALANSILASAHLHSHHADSALLYAFRSLDIDKSVGRKRTASSMYNVISDAYAQKRMYKEAYEYKIAYIRNLDSLKLNEAIKRSAALQYTFDIEKKESQINLLTQNEELTKNENRQQKILLLIAAAAIVLVALFGVIMWRNSQQKQKAYIKLEQQQTELKATQAQLIQSEKMASLGELTAGIAHEIQNPLNFVNNFSEVNIELVDELKEELKAGNTEDAIAIADNIRDNEQKISFHGKRADSIVKGMLHHSRNSSGIKEPTDINLLADEYLRLAYHGLRAKDKSFNASMKTDFDTHIGTVNVVAQDIGRVILNLITNAFYSVNEKKKNAPAGYEPTVTVSTQPATLPSGARAVAITVRDNGNGIPPKIAEKIFQPFFTTKPTGEGTGLGLSMSYEIVNKGHGGELTVKTEEGEYAAFTITIPL